MAKAKKTSAKKATPKLSVPAIREYVIVRCKDAGVHAGYLESQTRDHVILTESRRIWYWTGAASLSEIAVFGLNPAKCSGSKIAAEVSRIQLRQSDVCEIIACSQDGKSSLEGMPVWRA